MTAVTTYNGNCHCGRNRFQVTLPEIKSAESCDCSLCCKTDFLWAFPDEGNLTGTRGDSSTLLVYKTSAVEHEFCSHCGTHIKGRHISGPLKDKIGVNARSLLGVNPFALKIQLVDGKSQEDHNTHEFGGALPEFTGDNVKTYTGACHCGAVRVALKTAPLPVVELKQDNCSICVRAGSIYVYPDKDQVVIVGRESTTDYKFGRGFNGTPFCSTCGCVVFTNLYGPPQAVIDRLPKERLAFVTKQLRIQPVNVRVLEGVEWDEIQVTKSDEGTEGYALED